MRMKDDFGIISVLVRKALKIETWIPIMTFSSFNQDKYL